MFKSLKRAFFATLMVPVATAAGIATGTPTDDMSETIEALLDAHDLPGLSVAVVEDYRIVYAGAFGVKEAGTADKVDTETAFAAASISKAVTALVAAMLAEDGVLDLDAPVSSYLRRWKLPESPTAGHTPISLRHLLTHTAGTNQSGFGAYFEGQDIPTLVESLKGEKLGENRDPLAVMWKPDTRFRYSGGGFVVAQVAIEDATGASLAALADKLIFKPLGMAHTTLHQSEHPDFPANAAKAHLLDLKLAGAGGFPIYPQSGAAGMWSTPTDMAKLMTDLQRALRGDPGTVISPGVARETTRIQTLLKAGGWGLGWMRYLPDGNLDWFAHTGYGAGIGGQVMATMQGGRAVAVFGNGAHRVRVPVINAVIAAVIKQRGWAQDIEPAGDDAPSTEIFDGMQGYYRNLNRGFFSPFNEVVTIFAEDGQLMLDNAMGTRAPVKLIHRGGDRFRIDQFVSADIVLLGDGIAFIRDDAPAPAKALERLQTGMTPPYVTARKLGFAAGLQAYQDWNEAWPDTVLTRTWAFSRQAEAAFQAGRYEEAAVLYRIGLEFHPGDTALMKGLAKLEGETTP